MASVSEQTGIHPDPWALPTALFTLEGAVRISLQGAMKQEKATVIAADEDFARELQAKQIASPTVPRPVGFHVEQQQCD